MSHTNSTTNYSLPQFITTDKPAWLTDINNAFLAIDTGMNNAQTKADSAQNDATQALTDAAGASTAAATADAKGAGAVASLADVFNAAAIYSVGDIVTYNNLLYICEVAVITPGPWSGAANWSRVAVEDLIDTLRAEMNSASIATVGDSINLLSRICPGIVTSSGSRIRFWVDSSKAIDTANVTGSTISGTDLRVYGNAASAVISFADCTFSYTRRVDGILVTAELDNAITHTGAISVYFENPASISLT